MKSNEFIAEHKIDNRKGAGATPYNTDIDYFGFSVKMTPTMFLRLAIPGGGDSAKGLMKFINDGGAVASPMLYIGVPAVWKEEDFDPLNGDAVVIGHEGRNRMMAIMQIDGDIPVETHIILQSRGTEWRARHITDRIIRKINRGIVSEGEMAFIEGPLFK